MINVFPSLMNCAPVEQHEYAGTVGGFLESKGIEYKSRQVQPVTITVNGKVIVPARWATAKIKKTDDVQIRPIPRGGVLSFIRRIDPIMNWLLKSMSPRQQQNNTTGSGQQLETSDTTANVAKLNQIVPELAGRYIRYPDYLTPPRRYFLNQREQWLEFLCCIGPGQYQIDANDIKIGETTFAALGADAEYRIFQPGESMAGLSAQDIWYNATEIGGTSSGTAGLEIPTEYTGSNDGGTVATEYAFNGNAITITQPADGQWADGLRVGSRITAIKLPLPYTVSGISVDRITGNFQELLPLAVDDQVQVEGVPISATTVRIAAMELDAAGNGWVELKDAAGDPITTIPSGTQYITFRTAGITYYTVTAKSGKTINVQKWAGSPTPVPPPGWPGFATVTSTSATVDADTSSFAGDWTGTFCSAPKGRRTTSTQIDLFFTGGLAHVSDEGDIEQRTVQLEIAYRDRNVGGDFTIIVKTYTAATLDQIGYTETINHPSMEPEFKIRRLGVGSASSQDYEKVQWYGMRSFMGVKQVYPDWTTMSVRVRVGGKMAGSAENKVNVIATRILPVIQADGSFGSLQPTRDIAPFVRYIAQSIGYTDADLDMDELRRLDAVWKARGDTFDYVFDQTTVKEAINAVLGCGMAEMTVDGGLIRPVRDEPRTVFEQAYSPQNMTAPLRRTFRKKSHDDYDGVEVEFMNAETWTKETIMCLLPGDLGANPERIRVIGATHPTKAWRIGMRRRRQHRYIVWNYQFSTEMDAFNSRYLSYVPLIDNLKGYGQSAIMENITPSGAQALVRVTEPLEWEEGKTHVFGYRREDGTMAGPYAATPGPDEFHILAPIPQPWPTISLDQEPPHAYFGTTERWVFPALIKNVSPTGLDAATVTAENYDARKYLDDDNAPPA